MATPQHTAEVTVESHAAALPTGLAGLRYPITQISLAVRDLDRTMAAWHDAFGWAPWNVFDHVPPVHHNTMLRGVPVHYALRGAEVYVGAMNFELLEPLEGPNLWTELIDARREGIASIAVMFSEREDGDAVKSAFRERYGIEVSMKADIGDHIEYYYLDTEERFGCLIESGSGHAIDFVGPATVYPHRGASQVAAPASGIRFPEISQVTLVVRDLDAKLAAWHEAFGWGPWSVYEPGDAPLLRESERHGREVEEFRLRWAEANVGEIGFEIVQPLGGDSPWQEHLDTKGEGLFSISVLFDAAGEAARVRDAFAAQGIGVDAAGKIGDALEFFLLDSVPRFKCAVKSGWGRAREGVPPTRVYPAPPG